MAETTTTDLSKFGYRELDMAGELLTAIQDGLPNDFDNDEITVMFNMNSGFVFLTNSEYQIAMLDDSTQKLYSFYTTPYEGREGSWEELMDDFETMHHEDKQYMREIAEAGDHTSEKLEVK